MPGRTAQMCVMIWTALSKTYALPQVATMQTLGARRFPKPCVGRADPNSTTCLNVCNNQL
jgi:hypothetical protein